MNPNQPPKSSTYNKEPPLPPLTNFLSHFPASAIPQELISYLPSHPLTYSSSQVTCLGQINHQEPSEAKFESTHPIHHLLS